jgi:hypothetical protein
MHAYTHTIILIKTINEVIQADVLWNTHAHTCEAVNKRPGRRGCHARQLTARVC